MKNVFVFLMVLVAGAVSAHAENLCGELRGYCVNGDCEDSKTLTPTYVTNGGTEKKGTPVSLIPDNKTISERINHFIGFGQGTRVCVEGLRTGNGSLRITKIESEASVAKLKKKKKF